jgi:hypothetical protein
MTAPKPMEASLLTKVRSTPQSYSVGSAPLGVVEWGQLSLIKVTPCPMKTLSSTVTPSLLKVRLEILQRFPSFTFFFEFLRMRRFSFHRQFHHHKGLVNLDS